MDNLKISGNLAKNYAIYIFPRLGYLFFILFFRAAKLGPSYFCFLIRNESVCLAFMSSNLYVISFYSIGEIPCTELDL